MRLSVPLGNFFTTRKQSPSLLRVTQWTPASLSTPRCTKSTYARSIDDDLAGFDARADLRGTDAVGGLGRFDQHEARQQAVQVQPHMELGGGFTPAVLEPSRCRRQSRQWCWSPPRE